MTKDTTFVVIGALRVNMSYLCSMCLKEMSPRDVSFMPTTFFEGLDGGSGIHYS